LAAIDLGLDRLSRRLVRELRAGLVVFFGRAWRHTLAAAGICGIQADLHRMPAAKLLCAFADFPGRQRRLRLLRRIAGPVSIAKASMAVATNPAPLIEIKAGGSSPWSHALTVVQRQDWRSTAVNRLRARICLRHEPVYRRMAEGPAAVLLEHRGGNPG
jgi:hypothetical protein